MISAAIFLSAIACVSAFANNSTTASLKKDAIPTVSSLDLKSYQGHWFQMYDNKRAAVFTPKDNQCVTADYTLRADGKIGVHNYGITDKGVVNTIDGIAYSDNAAEPGQLKLQLDGVPVEADYWVNE